MADTADTGRVRLQDAGLHRPADGPALPAFPFADFHLFRDNPSRLFFSMQILSSDQKER
jgi:hypothetical protein